MPKPSLNSRIDSASLQAGQPEAPTRTSYAAASLAEVSTEAPTEATTVAQSTTRRQRLQQRLLGWRTARLRFRAVHAVTLLQSGTEYFQALARHIDAATTSVYLETYIFCHDDAGTLISAALRRAARRGVDVRVITDGVGTARLPMFEEWGAAGIAHRIFNPRWVGPAGVARDHRKLAVVDRQIAYVGGMNIVDDWMNDGHRLDAPRWDFAVELRGPVVQDVVLAFETQWARVDPARRPADALSMASRKRLRRERRFLARDLTESAVPGPQVALVARDNRLNRRAIERAYLHAIGRATRQIVLANPYFTPGRRLRRALNEAARRGVDVQLLIGRKEFRLLDWAVPSLYGSFLSAGVRIAEYNKALLHGKVAVVDDEWGTVGSSNLDALSLFLNHEANVVVLHDPMIHQLRAAIERAFAQAQPIDRDRYATRRWPKRLLNWAAYAVYRFAMRLLTVGRFD